MFLILRTSLLPTALCVRYKCLVVHRTVPGSQQRNPRVIQQSLNNLACEVKACPGSTGSVSSRATALLPGTALVIRGGHKKFAGQKLGIKICVLQDSCKKQYVFLSILLVVS